MGCGSARHGGGVLPDTLPALTRQQSRPYVAESAAQWTRSPVRRTSRSSSSPWPPAAPRVAAPLVAAHAHVFVVQLLTSHAVPLLRAAPALRGLHRRPQTACFGTGSTATTAAAVTAWSHIMLLPPALWCCACPCGTRPGHSCTHGDSCDCSRPVTPCTRSLASCSGSHPLCSDPHRGHAE